MTDDPTSSSPSSTDAPVLSAVVVHWRNEEEVAALVDAWPTDPRLELVVVDNSRSVQEAGGSTDARPARWIVPEANLGFAGGANRGAAEARGEWVLILNPDVAPEPGAWDALLDACERHGDAAGIAPALVHPDGTSQCRWQLQPLPSPATLILQTLFLGGRRGPRREPEDGTPVGQPAAAALALRRGPLLELGGFDERFFPAWFEDVDLAKRLGDRGGVFRYAPSARFVHSGGGSVPALGYGPFLWIYYRNLEIYLRRHHHRAWAWLSHLTLPLAMTLRLLALPLRRPRRAPSHRDAAAGLLSVLYGCVTGWRRPRAWARRFSRRPEDPQRPGDSKP